MAMGLQNTFEFQNSNSNTNEARRGQTFPKRRKKNIKTPITSKPLCLFSFVSNFERFK
jgi:hypothetical protein